MSRPRYAQGSKPRRSLALDNTEALRKVVRDDDDAWPEPHPFWPAFEQLGGRFAVRAAVIVVVGLIAQAVV